MPPTTLPSSPDDDHVEYHAWWLPAAHHFPNVGGQDAPLFLEGTVQDAAEEGQVYQVYHHPRRGEARIFGSITYSQAACVAAGVMLVGAHIILQKASFF